MPSVERWKDFSFFLVSALKKLPALNVTTFRGENKRVTELSRQYHKNNQVCRITFTATTRNKDDTIKAFGNGGTLFKLKIFDGRDISKLSLYESEMEVILWPNSTFRVTATLSSDEVRELDGLADGLPGDVDLIVLEQVGPEPVRQSTL
jgi:hypothetical protein